MITVHHLCKQFKVAQPEKGIWEKMERLVVPQHKMVRAVDDVSFEINKGEILGYLGPNGAGQSTTIFGESCTSFPLPATKRIWTSQSICAVIRHFSDIQRCSG